jgi:hypothetical protein
MPLDQLTAATSSLFCHNGLIPQRSTKIPAPGIKYNRVASIEAASVAFDGFNSYGLFTGCHLFCTPEKIIHAPKMIRPHPTFRPETARTIG